MAKLKIKKGDLVQVVSGPRSERGKQGKVISVDTERQRVLVEGVRRVTKHTKATPGRTGSGGLVHTEAPVHVSNVMLVDPKDKKPTRVGFRTETVERDGRQRTVRVRVAKRSGEEI
jgi:large subunit ribosomal protein L24